MREAYLSLATKSRQVWEHGSMYEQRLKIAWAGEYPPPGEEVSALHFPEAARVSGEVCEPPWLWV